jgi:PAS domain S-box-containing protein
MTHLVEQAQSLRLLLVEDSPDDALLVLHALRRGGFAPDVERVETEEAMLAALQQRTWDAVIADFTLPRFNALRALDVLKSQELDIPFIIVSGALTDEIAVAAMKAGAHDYILKDNLARLAPAMEREVRDANIRVMRRQVELALRQVETRFAIAFRASPMAICITTLAEGRLLDVNDSCVQLLGFSREELIGRTTLELQLWADPDERERLIDLLRANKHVRNQELVVRTKTGELRNILCSFEIIDLDGQACLLAYLSDITERKQAETTRATLAALIESTDDAVIGKTLDGTITSWNPAATRLFGYTAAEIIGRSVTILQAPHRPDEAREILARIRRGERIAQYETVRRHKDGTLIDISLTISPILDADGTITGISTLAHDIRERKRQERHQASLLAMAAALRGTATRDDMASTVLNTLLALTPASAGALIIRDSGHGDCVVEVASGTWSGWTGVRLPLDADPGGQSAPSEAMLVTGAHLIERLGRFITICPADLVAVLPLRAYQHQLGTLLVGYTAAIDEHELRGLAALAEIAANALHRATMHEQTQQRLRRLMALRAIDLAITASADLRVTLQILLDQVTAQLGVDAAAVLLFERVDQRLAYAAGRGFRGNTITQARFRVGEGLAGRAALERRIFHVANVRASQEQTPGSLFAEEDVHTCFAVPLLAKGQIKGVLEIFHRSPLDPDTEWIEFLEMLAGQAAIAVDNASLFEELQQSNAELATAYDATIEGWSRALDLRDKETEGHTQRVTDMTVRLARAFGLSDADLLSIRRGALLHDIGKMGIPDQILLKPGPLTDEEWTIMRRHPVYAYELLSPIAFLRSALDIPYYHHERWDGTGYPHGLKGDQIPLAARIFAVVDVWDALRSDRPYRKGWPDDRVINHIKAGRGTHFDPDVVDLFLSMYPLTGETRPKPALLIVDDEVAITRSLARSLRADFTVHTATSGDEALALLRSTPVAVILTDQRMPGMSGVELLEQARQIRPETIGLLLSGYSDSPALVAAINLGVRGFIAKPWNTDDLRARLWAVLGTSGTSGTLPELRLDMMNGTTPELLVNDRLAVGERRT